MTDLWGLVGALLAAIAIIVAIIQLRQGRSIADPRKAALSGTFGDFERKFFELISKLEELQSLVNVGTQNSPEGLALQSTINGFAMEVRAKAAMVAEAFNAFCKNGKNGAACVEDCYSTLASLFNSRQGNLDKIRRRLASVRQEVHNLCK